MRIPPAIVPGATLPSCGGRATPGLDTGSSSPVRMPPAQAAPVTLPHGRLGLEALATGVRFSFDVVRRVAAR